MCFEKTNFRVMDNKELNKQESFFFFLFGLNQNKKQTVFESSYGFVMGLKLKQLQSRLNPNCNGATVFVMGAPELRH